MDYSSMNCTAVIVYIAVSMISGSFWYNPRMFFLTWWKGRRILRVTIMSRRWNLLTIGNAPTDCVTFIRAHPIHLSNAGVSVVMSRYNKIIKVYIM